MRIGAMNHPARDPIQEIQVFAGLGMEFLDLTLEPPGAAVWNTDLGAVCRALKDANMGVVGHTAYYLPIGHPFERVRQAAVDELKSCLDAFADVGAEWMNVHPDRHAPFHERPFTIEQNVKSLRALADHARKCGVGVMVENLPGEFNTAAQLADLLDPVPDISLHLDIGHCNLRTAHNTASELLSRFGDRVAHVHLHDNNAHADLHLPLGAGKLNVAMEVSALKAAGYDSTITLEVFSEDKAFLVYSRDVLRRLWDESDNRAIQ